MNTVALTKALRFACLPTLSLLILLFFAFFDISKTLEFISSSDGLAIFLRVAAFLGEVILVVIMYNKYRAEEIMKGSTELKNKREVYEGSYIRNIKSNWSSRDTYYIQDTENDNIVYIQRKPASNI